MEIGKTHQPQHIHQRRDKPVMAYGETEQEKTIKEDVLVATILI